MTHEDMTARLAHVPALGYGKHRSIKYGACVMEAVAFVAGRPWSDSPPCACPVIGGFLRVWNDALPDNERDALLRPLILRIPGTKASAAREKRRSLMALNWLVRTHTPAWLRLAKLNAQADALAGLPEITGMAQISSMRDSIEAARRDTITVPTAVMARAWAAALNAIGAAAGGAAVDAAWGVTMDAVEAETLDTIGGAAVDAAWGAAMDAARAAAGDALNETRLMLQRSAIELVKRMIEVR